MTNVTNWFHIFGLFTLPKNKLQKITTLYSMIIFFRSVDGFNFFFFFGKRLNNCSVEFHCHIINGISKMGQDFRKQMHVGENAIHPMLKVEMFPCFPGLSPYILTLSKSSIIDSDILFEGFSFCYNKPAFPEIPSSTTFLKVTGHHLKCSRCCVWWRKRDAFRTPSIF